MGADFPPSWHHALARRRAHFDISADTTVRLLHDEDLRVRCDRFGAVSWFYWYGPTPPSELDCVQMAAFADAAGSPHWKARLMRNRGRNPTALREWGGTAIDRWTAAEEDLRYIFRTDHGLSPGLFLDQRANRRWIRTQARDRRVLNLFSYTGGFSLNSALGGAAEVVNVDTSRPTLDWAQANFALNGLPTAHCEFWKADARYFLRGCRNRGRVFDLVVCDPPSFSRSREGTFKIERDLGNVLQAIDPILAPQGRILIATNFETWNESDLAQVARKALPGFGSLDLPLPDSDLPADQPLMKALALAKP